MDFNLNISEEATENQSENWPKVAMMKEIFEGSN